MSWPAIDRRHDHGDAEARRQEDRAEQEEAAEHAARQERIDRHGADQLDRRQGLAQHQHGRDEDHGPDAERNGGRRERRADAARELGVDRGLQRKGAARDEGDEAEDDGLWGHGVGRPAGRAAGAGLLRRRRRGRAW